MKFDWDSAKALLNEKKHGLSFEQAITAFDDPMALVAPDPKHSTLKEERQWLIGQTDLDTVVVVVFTDREDGKIRRIISARSASRKERNTYETLKRIPL